MRGEVEASIVRGAEPAGVELLIHQWPQQLDPAARIMSEHLGGRRRRPDRRLHPAMLDTASDQVVIERVQPGGGDIRVRVQVGDGVELVVRVAAFLPAALAEMPQQGFCIAVHVGVILRITDGVEQRAHHPVRIRQAADLTIGRGLLARNSHIDPIHAGRSNLKSDAGGHRCPSDFKLA